MTIEIDATEARANTRLPLSSTYHSVTGLESLTGADILIHPFKPLPGKLNNNTPHRMILNSYCDQGMLIQRKSGPDFLSSISDLAEIEKRMYMWSPNPWLLVTRLYELKNNRVGVRGTRRSYSHWKWENVQSSYDWWQMRGGSVIQLHDDSRIDRWFQWAEGVVRRICDDPVKNIVHKIPQQSINEEDQNWVNTGRAWPPGVGKKLLENLARYVESIWHRPPTLANCMALACSDECIDVPLWGKKRRSDVRQWVGSGEKGLTMLNGEMYEIVKRKLGTLGNPMEIGEGEFAVGYDS